MGFWGQGELGGTQDGFYELGPPRSLPNKPLQVWNPGSAGKEKKTKKRVERGGGGRGTGGRRALWNGDESSEICLGLVCFASICKSAAMCRTGGDPREAKARWGKTRDELKSIDRGPRDPGPVPWTVSKKKNEGGGVEHSLGPGCHAAGGAPREQAGKKTLMKATHGKKREGIIRIHD